MPIEKEGGRRPPSKVQHMPPTFNSSKITRHAPTDDPVARNSVEEFGESIQTWRRNHLHSLLVDYVSGRVDNENPLKSKRNALK